MARNTFYHYQKQSKLSDKYGVIKNLIKSIYHKYQGRFGYRRITDEIKNKGFVINHKAFLRLMKSLSLKSKIRIKNLNPTKVYKVK